MLVNFRSRNFSYFLQVWEDKEKEEEEKEKEKKDEEDLKAL